MDLVPILIVIAYLLSSHLIAQYLGRKRLIGYGGSVFVSVLLSPIVGLIVTLFSKPSQQLSEQKEG